MKEVSCRAFDVYFHDLKKRGIPAEILVRGTPYGVAHLQDKHERVEWEVFVQIMDNAATVYTDEEFISLGGVFMRNPLVRSLTVVARLLFNARDFYFWAMSRGSGAGNQLFTCVVPTVRDLGPDRIEIELEVSEGYTPCRYFFLVSRGTLQAFPELLGLGSAEVEMTEKGRCATYEVRIPPGGGALAKVRRAVMWPFNARTAARELREANEVLTVRYAELEDYRNNLEHKVEERTRELREAQAARDRIFANINHEIRTPLSLIRLAVDRMLRNGAQTVEASEQLRGIERNSHRLLHLVDGLLLLAAGQEGKLRPRRIDAARLVAELVSAWRPQAEEAGLSLDYKGPTTLIVVVDDAALERAVANLISNAIKFTAVGGVGVEVSSHEHELSIVVADTGVGIEPEARERVFQRFEQAAPAVRPTGRGSGIGLSIVREIVEAHGGSVSVQSADSGGSSFRITLPVTVTQTQPEAVPRVMAPERVSTREGAIRSAEGVATLLVAEDEPEMLDAICQIVGQRHRVIAARDGEEALLLAAEHLPDLLVSDVGMPGMDGFELTRRFRELPGNRLAPVLLLTAFGDLRSRLEGFEAGAIDYVLKPFEAEELVARVEALLAMRTMALRLSESEKLASLGTLSAGLAHEFRNPANGVVNAIGPLRELLPEDLTDADTPTGQLIDVLEQCGEQIAGLSRQLLGYANQGKLSSTDEPFAPVLERALTLAATSLKKRSVETDVEEGASLPCAAAFLAQALANLLQNSAEACGAGGTVTLRAFRNGSAFVIETSDSGPGVPAEMRERVFDPFFTTKPPGQGTGLGLFTARQIAEQHGGSLRIIQRDAVSVFRFELPQEAPREGANSPRGAPSKHS